MQSPRAEVGFRQLAQRGLARVRIRGAATQGLRIAILEVLPNFFGDIGLPDGRKVQSREPFANLRGEIRHVESR